MECRSGVALQRCSQLLGIRDHGALVKLRRTSLSVTADPGGAFSCGGQERRGAWSSTRGAGEGTGGTGTPGWPRWACRLQRPGFTQSASSCWSVLSVTACFPRTAVTPAWGAAWPAWLLWGKNNRLCVTVRRRRPRPCPVGYGGLCPLVQGRRRRPRGANVSGQLLMLIIAVFSLGFGHMGWDSHPGSC